MSATPSASPPPPNANPRARVVLGARPLGIGTAWAAPVFTDARGSRSADASLSARAALCAGTSETVARLGGVVRMISVPPAVRRPGSSSALLTPAGPPRRMISVPFGVRGPGLSEGGVTDGRGERGALTEAGGAAVVVSSVVASESSSPLFVATAIAGRSRSP